MLVRFLATQARRLKFVLDEGISRTGNAGRQSLSHAPHAPPAAFRGLEACVSGVTMERRNAGGCCCICGCCWHVPAAATGTICGWNCSCGAPAAVVKAPKATTGCAGKEEEEEDGTAPPACSCCRDIGDGATMAPWTVRTGTGTGALTSSPARKFSGIPKFAALRLISAPGEVGEGAKVTRVVRTGPTRTGDACATGMGPLTIRLATGWAWTTPTPLSRRTRPGLCGFGDIPKALSEPLVARLTTAGVMGDQGEPQV